MLFRAHDVDTYLAMLRAKYLFQPGRVLVTRDAFFALGAFVLVVTLMAGSRLAPGLLTRLRRPAARTGLGYAGALAAVLVFAPTATAPFIYYRF